MKCPEIKELLSEYLDGALEGEKKKLVEEHLAACPACSAELSARKAYREEMRSLEEIKPPPDFLEKIHDRLEERFSFEKVIRTIFIPLKIKVPLELAAAAATILVVAVVYHSSQPVQRFKSSAPGAREAFSRKEGPADYYKLARNNIADHSISRARADDESVISGLREDKKRVESAAVSSQEKEIPEEPAVAKLKMEKQSVGLTLQPEIKEKPLELVLLLETEPRGRKFVPAAARGKSNYLRAQPPAPALAEETEKPRATGKDMIGAEQMDSLTAPSSGPRGIVAELKKMVLLSGGEVVSVEERRKTEAPRFLVASIPADNYGSFLEKLAGLGRVEMPPPPGEAARARKSVLIRIEIISPKLPVSPSPPPAD